MISWVVITVSLSMDSRLALILASVVLDQCRKYSGHRPIFEFIWSRCSEVGLKSKLISVSMIAWVGYFENGGHTFSKGTRNLTLMHVIFSFLLLLLSRSYQSIDCIVGC